MNIRNLLNPKRVSQTEKDAPDTSRGTSSGKRNSGLTAARHVHSTAKYVLAAFTLTIGVAALSRPAWAQTEDDLAKQYKIETMEQALQTKEHYDLYGLRFASDQSTVPADAKPFLDDIADDAQELPRLAFEKIVGHTDATGDPQPNEALSLERANAIKAGLVERGIEEQRLAAAGAGEKRPVAGNDTAEGRAHNRRVELMRFTTRRRPSDCSRRCRIIWMHRKRYLSTTMRRSRS